MDAAQARYVALPPGCHALLGIPGGGKTSTLLRRVARLVADGALPREGGFLLLTFSKDAAEELRSSGERLEAGLFTRENTCTLHALSRRLAASAPDAHPLIRDNVGTYVRYFLDRLRSVTTDAPFLASVRERLPNLRAVFVDEAQDLCEYHYETVLLMASALGVDWIEMVGDPDQNIFESMQGSSPQFLMQHSRSRGGQDVRLRTNFRSTPAIVRFANAMRPSDVPASDAMVAWVNGGEGRPEGDKPFVTFGDIHENVRAVVARIVSLRDAGEPLEGIAVLGMVRKTFASGPTHNASLTLVANLLETSGVPTTVHFSEVGHDGGGADRSPAAPVAGRVNLLTTHSSKGRAWRHVLVINFNMQALGFLRNVEEVNRILYVAATRARVSLAVYVNVGPMHQAWPAPPVWRLPAKMPASGLSTVVGDPGTEPPPPPVPKPNSKKMRVGCGVTDFLSKMFALDGGRVEYDLLCKMADVGGLSATMVATFPPAEPLKASAIHHNDYTILGKAAELVAHRAAKLCAATRDFVLEYPLAPPKKHSSMVDDILRRDSKTKWESMTAMLATDPVKAIVNHCYYDHQVHHEARYRLNRAEGRRGLMVRRVRAMAGALEAQGAAFERIIGRGVEYERHVDRKKRCGRLMYHGFVDACTVGAGITLCEFKFSHEPFSFKAVMQLVMYAHSDAFEGASPPARLLLWNLRLGLVQQVFYDRARMASFLSNLEAGYMD